MLELRIHSRGIINTGKSLFPNLILKFPANSISVLIGPNGGGKTSILRSLLSPVEGINSISINDEEITKESFTKRSKLISYIGTSPGDRPHIRVLDFLSFSFYKALQSKDKVNEILGDLKLEHLENAFIDELSDGEYKRVYVASGLLQDASWYVLDEPEEHLDPLSLNLFVKKIMKMKTNGSSFVIACHNLHFASAFADYFIGVSSDSSLSFVKERNDVLRNRNFDSLFSCKFKYDLEQETPLFIGPIYE